VYYSFYNPPTVPYQNAVPRRAAFPLEDEGILVGCRVILAEAAHSVLSGLPIGRTPQFREMVVDPPLSSDSFGNHGWRLEQFIADEVLRCRQGRLFNEDDDADLHALLYAREAPIASLIYIAFDLPGD